MSPNIIKPILQLNGARIYLRPLKVEDAPIFLEATQVDEIRHMTGLKRNFNLAEIEAHIRRCLDHPLRYDFAICLQADHCMIGELSVLEIDPENLTAEFRIALSQIRFTSQGYGSEAIELIKTWAFKQLRLKTLSLQVFGHNPRGIRAYEKCGFQVMEVKKEAFEYQDKYSDEIMMQARNPLYE